MLNYLCAAAFVMVAVINLLPVAGVLSDAWLVRLYLIEAPDGTLSVLLRHRAVLFGIVGGLLMVAAFKPDLRPLATVAGMLSMVSYVLLMVAVQPGNASLTRVAWIDVAAIVVLAAGYAAHATRSSGPQA